MTALNGKDGLIKAKSRVPDVVICDYMMPGMDGLAVCRAIRADDTIRDVTIILWSAARGVDAGGLADLTIEKPVHIDSFALSSGAIGHRTWNGHTEAKRS